MCGGNSFNYWDIQNFAIFWRYFSSTFLYIDITFSVPECNNESYVHIGINFTNLVHSNKYSGPSIDAIILVYVISDALWIVTSVTLMSMSIPQVCSSELKWMISATSCCSVKGVWSLVFYLPWIILNALVLIFDVYCSIHIGLTTPNAGVSILIYHNLRVSSQLKLAMK